MLRHIRALRVLISSVQSLRDVASLAGLSIGNREAVRVFPVDQNFLRIEIRHGQPSVTKPL
jgi:hypothetical protein